MAYDLSGKTVAVISTDQFEDSELQSPAQAVKDAGANVVVLAPEAGSITGKKGAEVPVDQTTADALAAGTTFDGILIPGGTSNSDQIRMDEAAVEIVKKHNEAGTPIAAICHGPWLLIEAEAVRDKNVTSYPSLRTDLVNAGAKWEDSEVVCDKGLVTSRTPRDLEAFNAKFVEELAEGSHKNRR